ncbi:MAG: selenide, water dikinase SelD [Bacteroidia bacterium]
MTEVKSEIKLTEYAHGAGCGCKLEPGKLKEILSGKTESKKIAELLAGNEGNEDAAVWKIDENNLLISTTDFFMPIVDDAFDFGCIAAANAISDVYAMGAKPALALAILGWPSKLPLSLATEVMNGATSICEKAGIVIAGGHTIESEEPFFGLSVNGFVQPKHLKRNNTVKKGDLLFLTKPLGSGILSTASKRNKLSVELTAKLIASMKKLNSVGESLGKIEGVSAMTDVTGFGLLGHLSEMIAQQSISVKIDSSKVPKMDGVDECIKSFIYPDITTSNFKWIEELVSPLNAEQLFLLCDPQTSGGLLFSASQDTYEEVKSVLIKNDCFFEPIGIVEEYQGKVIFVN